MKTPLSSIALVLLFAFGCSAGSDAPTVSYVDDVSPLLSEYCTIACHGGGLYPDGPYLGGYGDAPGVAYDAVVGIPSSDVPSMNLVEPGDPDNSYLWHKLNNTHLGVGGEGEPMPKCWSFSEGGGTHCDYPIGAADLEVITTWIQEGALP